MGTSRDAAGEGAFAAFWPWTLVGLALLLAWDASGLDLLLARAMADGHRFRLRDEWLLAGPLHQGMRQAALATAAWLGVGVWRPTGILRRLTRPVRIRWLAGVLLASLLINAFKHWSRTSCPWDLAEFGGTGVYLSHWAWGLPDGGPGHCFPAGHASAGFAFIGGFLAFRPVSKRLAAVCLFASIGAGLGLGLVQQLRGAHFMSHTLWTAWWCWVVAWLTHVASDIVRPQGAGILTG